MHEQGLFQLVDILGYHLLRLLDAVLLQLVVPGGEFLEIVHAAQRDPGDLRRCRVNIPGDRQVNEQLRLTRGFQPFR